MKAIILAGQSGHKSQVLDEATLRAINNVAILNEIVILTDNTNIEMQLESSIRLVTVPASTCGALATLGFALAEIPDGTPFLVLPSNAFIPSTHLTLFSESMLSAQAIVGAVVFEGNDPVYSYARLDAEGEIMEIVEKLVLGSCALAGIFFFSSKKHLSSCIKWALVNNARNEGKFFVAPALNFFIAHSMKINLYRISSEDYVRH